MTFFMHVNCKRKKIVIAIDFCIGNHEMQTFHCNVANELSKQNLILCTTKYRIMIGCSFNCTVYFVDDCNEPHNIKTP